MIRISENLIQKDSEPAEPWSGLKDATKFGNVCAQKDFFTRRTLGNEDCLFLNVYTSDLKPVEPRAVMVWIHGGAFFFGSGNDDIYGPDYLVEKDVVVVTINYRLGMIGNFLMYIYFLKRSFLI